MYILNVVYISCLHLALDQPVLFDLFVLHISRFPGFVYKINRLQFLNRFQFMSGCVDVASVAKSEKNTENLK